MARGLRHASVPILVAAVIGLFLLEGHGSTAARVAVPVEPPTPPLSILTYNVHGLPWPLASGRDAALARIAGRLRALRASGAQPHIVLLQEAFTPAAKRIAAEAGYPFAAAGPSETERAAPPPDAADLRYEAGRSWRAGEGLGKRVDSGLLLLSDYPVLKVRRLAFPDYACAGFDCLANKGVLLAELALPRGRVDIATTHMVSRFAAEVPDSRNFYAYRREADLLGSFLAAQSDPAVPLILAGDFNVGIAPGRRAVLIGALGRAWSESRRALPADALRNCVSHSCPGGHAPDALWTMARARDWQFYAPAPGGRLAVSAIRVLFGHEPGGMLSDHVGYEADYALAPARPG